MAQFFRKCKSVMAYWQHAHKTKTMPAEFSEQLKTSKEETNRIVKFAKSCGAGAAKKKKTCFRCRSMSSTGRFWGALSIFRILGRIKGSFD
jgi:hypothetical protein